MGAPVPPTLSFEIRGPIERSDLDGLCDRVCGLLRASSGLVVGDGRGAEADAVTVDALARLQLGARRTGCRVQLCGATAELSRLVEFMGLSEVLPG